MELPTNIFVRLGVIQQTLDNVFNYYDYVIGEHETPEILAENFYGDPELHWLILMTNRMIDAQYDWPMKYETFQNFITQKYGSIDDSQLNYVKWYRVLKLVDNTTGTITIRNIDITEYDYDNSLLPTDEGSGSQYTVDGQVVTVYETKKRVLAYDWENDQNEARRQIKLIKKEYVPDIQAKFLSIMGQAGDEPNSVFVRKLT